MKFYKKIIFMLVTLVSLISLPTTFSYASESNWKAETKSYRVYLGVIPASIIKKNISLIDGDKSLHGGENKITSNSQHIMVSIFSRSGNKRILNATTIAKLKNKKIFGKKNITKPLEKMKTSGSITYGNYFNIRKKGKYVFDVDIYQPNKNGYEKASFLFKNY